MESDARTPSPVGPWRLSLICRFQLLTSSEPKAHSHYSTKDLPNSRTNGALIQHTRLDNSGQCLGEDAPS